MTSLAIVALFILLGLMTDERSFDLRRGAELEFESTTVQLSNDGDAPLIQIERRF